MIGIPSLDIRTHPTSQIHVTQGLSLGRVIEFFGPLRKNKNFKTEFRRSTTYVFDLLVELLFGFVLSTKYDAEFRPTKVVLKVLRVFLPLLLTKRNRRGFV